MIGKKLSPILVEIENTLWEFEANSGMKPEFTDEAFMAATKIFMSILMDKMWNLQTNENISNDDRIKMAENAGNEIRQLIKTYTGMDTHDFYKE